MARTKAKVGKGTTLHYADDTAGTPGSYTKVGELVKVSQPKISGGTSDATHYESDSSFEESIVSGWKKGEPVPFMINYEKSQHSTLVGLVNVEKDFKVTLPDGSTYTFYGAITEFGGDEIPLKETMRSSGTMSVLGVVTFTAAS